jgi:hypothetical protein
MLAPVDPVSAWIAGTMRPHVHTGSAADLRAADIFNYYPFLNNLVFAHRALSTSPALAEAGDPTPAAGLTWFPGAGIARMRTPAYDAYVGTAKGGVLVVFDRRSRTLVDSDCGYLGTLNGGGSVSTQYQDPARPTRLDAAGIEVEGALVRFSRPTMRPVLFVCFRLFTLTLGRAPGLARWLKQRLVTTLIYRRQPLAVQHTRRIEFGDGWIRVRDRLIGPDGTRLGGLWRSPRFATIHMGSSRYFILNELRPLPSDAPVDPHAIVRGVVLERTISV